MVTKKATKPEQAAKVKPITPPEQIQEGAGRAQECAECEEHEHKFEPLTLNEIDQVLWHISAQLMALRNDPELLDEALTDANAKDLIFLLDDLKTAQEETKAFRKAIQTYCNY